MQHHELKLDSNKASLTAEGHRLDNLPVPSVPWRPCTNLCFFLLNINYCQIKSTQLCSQRPRCFVLSQKTRAFVTERGIAFRTSTPYHTTQRETVKCERANQTVWRTVKLHDKNLPMRKWFCLRRCMLSDPWSASQLMKRLMKVCLGFQKGDA